MARAAQEITDAELAVLQLLWELSQATVRQLADRLYPGGGASQYATVQKFLERLEIKGFVHRTAGSAANVFSPAIAREEVIGRRVRSVAEKLCGGSLASLVTHLVRTQRLTSEERRSLRALIDELDKAK